MNTLTSVILSALHDTRDMGLTVEERAEAIADAVRKHRRTSEPNAIALLREGVFVPNAVDCDHILAAYDAIVDECDSDITNLVQERATLRARLAACERVVEAARAVVLDARAQHGYDQYAVGTATIDALRAAVTAETQE